MSTQNQFNSRHNTFGKTALDELYCIEVRAFCVEFSDGPLLLLSRILETCCEQREMFEQCAPFDTE